MHKRLVLVASFAALAWAASCTSYQPLSIEPTSTPFPLTGVPTQAPTPATASAATSAPAQVTSGKVVSLIVTPTSATLSVPPENPGLASAGFPTSLPLDVRETLDNGQLLDGDVVWTSSNPELVQVTWSGALSTALTTGGAKPTGLPVILTATARRDPSKVATVSVAVTDDATAIVQLQ